MDLATITRDVHKALQELLEVASLQPKQILVVGCSTSEVGGEKLVRLLALISPKLF